MAAQGNFLNDQFRDQETGLADTDTSNGASTSDFLRLFDRDNHWFRVWREKQQRKVEFDKAASFESYQDYFTKLNSDDYGIFFVVNTTDGKGGKDSNIVKIKALFLDLDGAPLEPVLQAGLKPTAIIESSPGRYHAYYLVTDDLPVAEYTKYQKALARRFNGDSSISNPSRLMRLPGFYHNKQEPFLSHITEFNPDRKYTVTELAEGLELDLLGRKKEPPVSTDAIRKVSAGSRNSYIFKQSVKLLNGLPESATLAAIRTLNAEVCDPPLDDDEIVSTVNSAFKTINQRILPMQSFQQLVNSEVQPLDWIVNGLFATGLSLLAGPPKTGKSWLCLELALKTANGEPLFDFYEIPQKRNVLYFALEDSESRLQERIKSIIGDKDVPDNAKIITKWTCDAKGLEALQRTITQDQIDLVIIDTLGKAHSCTDSSYKKDYHAIGQIQNVAIETGTCIVVVHHTRKAQRGQKNSNPIDPIEEVNGTTGLAGAADSIAILQKTQKANIFSLYLRGRDVEESIFSIAFDDYRWTLLGDISDTLCNESDINIYNVASVDNPLRPKELSDLTGMSHNTTKSVCKRLERKGLFKNIDGKYIKIRQFNNSKPFS